MATRFPSLFHVVSDIKRARRMSGRSIWLDTEQRWITRLDYHALFHRLARIIANRFFNLRTPTYEVRPRYPVVIGRRPRIVHVIANVFVGGSTQLLVDLHNFFGHIYEMHVMTAALPHGGEHKGINLHLFPMPANGAAMCDFLKVIKPDIVHVHYWGDIDTPWYREAFCAAESAGCSVVQNINTPVAPFLSPAIVLNVFVSIYVSKLANPGGPPSCVVYPGSDFELFRPASEPDPKCFDSIGMVYRLERDKLNDRSLEPLIEVVKRRRRTRVFVIGGGSLFDVFVAAVDAAGVRDNFVFTGDVPYAALPFWYSKFQTFVAPVWQESFGQVTPFAMAMGLAIAGNRVGALSEILECDNTLGVSPNDLTVRLLALLEEPERIRMLGHRNREIAMRRFSLPSMIRAYSEIYGKLLAPMRAE